MAAKRKAPAKRPAATQVTDAASQDNDPVQTQDLATTLDANTEALEVMTRSAPGFFRAGWKWSRKPRRVPLNNFEPAQIEALEREPELIVRRCKMGD